jgi:murein tripeptide amidase MpaA
VTYQSVTAIEDAIKKLATAYPALTQLITLPEQTYGGNTSSALRIGAGAPGSRDALMIIGGQHAREWGSPDIIVSFAADLLEAYDTNAGLVYGGKSYTAADVKGVVETLHLVLFPQTNPDGRAKSLAEDMPGTADGWRKNTNPGSPARPCAGVDLNRNYDFLFDYKTECAPNAALVQSTDPCDASQTYQGPAAFSEVETRNVAWLLDAFPRIRWFMDLHSFSQVVLYGWGDDDSQGTDPDMNFRNPTYDGKRSLTLKLNGDTTYKEYLPNGDELVARTLATAMADAIKAVRGKVYTAEPSVGLYPTTGTSTDWAYSRHFSNPAKGRMYAFCIEWGDTFRPLWPEMGLVIVDVSAALMELCLRAPCASNVTAVSLDTPSLQFIDVPESDTTSRAAVFTVQSCSAVTLQIQSGPSVTAGPGSFMLPLGAVESLAAAVDASPRQLRFWVSFTGTSPGDVTQGTMTIRCVETAQDFVIPITANTIAQPKVASVLVLDRSGSMLDPSGIPGKRRLDVLHESAPIYVNLLPDNAGIGVVSFDQDPHPVKPVVAADATGKSEANAGIAGHTPTGPGALTAIGDGVEFAHNTLEPLGGYDFKASVVFTDGFETAAKYIKDVESLINERVFALGLGTAEQLDPVALSKLVNKTDGYLLLTGDLNANDDLRLAKYFSQIQAGVTNAEVVVDPMGYLAPGTNVRIPFQITETDRSSTVFLLSPAPWTVDFRLETPDGAIIDAAKAALLPGVDKIAASRIDQYRMTFPVPLGGGVRQGEWHALLSIRKDYYKKYLSSFDRSQSRSAVHGVPYSLNVQAFSSLKMKARILQQSYQPGAQLTLQVVLTEAELPVEQRASVWVEIGYPYGGTSSLALNEVAPGMFEAVLTAPQPGIYPARFRAIGKTLRGYPFTREQLRTAAVWRGGDSPPPSSSQPPRGIDWCEFIGCLLSTKGILQLLERKGIDVDALRECVAGQCRQGQAPGILRMIDNPAFVSELIARLKTMAGPG